MGEDIFVFLVRWNLILGWGCLYCVGFVIKLLLMCSFTYRNSQGSHRIMYNLWLDIWKRLFAGAPPGNKTLFAGATLANKNLFVRTFFICTVLRGIPSLKKIFQDFCFWYFSVAIFSGTKPNYENLVGDHQFQKK